jgi:cytochrome c-type biogenesis protein CcmH/NrfF
LALSLFVLVLGVAHAQNPDPGDTSGRASVYDEVEAQRIDRMLMCPVCTGTTIEQSRATIALQMRSLVRQMLSQGDSGQEILDFFVDRYGTEILAAPPKSGVNLVAWLVPVFGVLGALAAGLVVIRSMTRQGARDGVDEAAIDDDLAPYLDIIDRNLGFEDSGLPGQTENRRVPNIVSGTGPEASNEPESATGDPKSPIQDVK